MPVIRPTRNHPTVKILTARNALLALAAFILAAIGSLLMLREPTIPLTEERLAEARRRWRQADVENYRAQYEMNRSRYDVTVRDGIVVEAVIDGKPSHGGQWRLWSIEGLFDTLAIDLNNLNNPDGALSKAKDAVILRVRFHPELGYVERYVRSSAGPGSGALIEMKEFTRLASDSDANQPPP